MYKHSKQSLQKGDTIIFFKNKFNHIIMIDSKPLVHIENDGQYYPIIDEEYKINSVEYDSPVYDGSSKGYFYEIERVDGKNEDIKYIIFEDSENKFYHYISQAEYHPSRIYLKKINSNKISK